MSSSARTTHDYQPTIIESKLLIKRLAIQIVFFKHELKRGWADFKRDPFAFVTCSTHSIAHRLGKLMTASNVTAVVAVTLGGRCGYTRRDHGADG